MSRLTDTLLNQKAFAKSANQPMLDLTLGGQFGYAPNISQFYSNAAYIRKNLFPIVLEAPRFFQLMPDPQKWVQTLKVLIENRSMTIEGLNATLKADFDEHQVGGAGEVQQEIVDMKRERSAPVHTFVEMYGMPITTFIQYWLQYGMMDPDTKYALVGTLSGQKPDDLLPDWFTATIIYIEPDPLFRKVMKAWVCTNMMPMEGVETIGKKDPTSPSEILKISMPFTAISQYGSGVNAFAQKIMDGIKITNANPYERASFIQNISSDLQAIKEGFSDSINAVSSNAVNGL